MKSLNRKQIIYLAVAICTAALILTVCVWAALGGSANKIKFIDGEVVLTKSIRSEYLVGEEVQTDGVELHVGKRAYTAEELTFTLDNQTAGDKMVEVSHTENGNCYRGYFPVTYFSVRHFDVRSHPTGVSYDEEGNITGVVGFELWAELSGEPHELPRPLEVHNYSTVIEVTEEYCDLIITEDEEYGGYIADISCGGQQIQYYFIELNGVMYTLEGKSRILAFNNESGSSANLTLFVTKMETDYSNGEDGAEGWYVYERADGAKQIYRFSYYRTGDASNFRSEGVSEALDGDDMLVQLDGNTFRATKINWHKAVFNE